MNQLIPFGGILLTVLLCSYGYIFGSIDEATTSNVRVSVRAGRDHRPRCDPPRSGGDQSSPRAVHRSVAAPRVGQHVVLREAAPIDGRLSFSVWATVTAYCPCERCCGAFSDGKTAIGRDAYRTRGVAVDGKLIPLRAKVTIPGAGALPFLADDTGGAMRQAARRGQYHVDLRFRDHGAALKWGRKRLLITVRRDR